MIDYCSLKSQIKDEETYNIYCYLLKNSDVFKVSEKTLMSVFGRGKLFINKRLKELKRLGLVKRIALRGTRGRFLGSQLITINPGVQIMQDETPQKPNNVIMFKRLHGDTSLSVVEDENELEKVMYPDAEQCRKAIYFKKKCLSDPKCLAMYERLPQSIKDDTSFNDIREECVTHYGGNKIHPLLVSPQRFLEWIKRKLSYADSNSSNETVLGNGANYYSKYYKDIDWNKKGWIDDILY